MPSPHPPRETAATHSPRQRGTSQSRSPRKPAAKQLSLPAIAKNPMARVAAAGVISPAQKAKTSWSPYLLPGDGLHKELWHVTASEEEANASVQEQLSPRSHRDADEGKPNELTRTYLNVLQHSENYNRRGVIQSRARTMASVKGPWDKLNAFVAGILQRYEQVGLDHQDGADDIDEQQARLLTHIVKLSDASLATARRHEDVRPTCPLIATGQTVHLDPACVDGMLMEIRWRGGIDIAIFALVFDDQGKHIGTASQTELIKGPESTFAVRHFGRDCDEAVLGTGSSRDSFQLCLANLPKKAHRVVFAALRGQHPGEYFHGLQRCWLTMYQQHGDATKQQYACRIADGGPFAAMAMACVVKRSQRQWLFQALNDTFAQVASTHRLGSWLSLGLADPQASLNAQLEFSRTRLCLQYEMLIEDASRRALVIEEADLRAECQLKK
jgi:hypothetical protein